MAVTAIKSGAHQRYSKKQQLPRQPLDISSQAPREEMA